MTKPLEFKKIKHIQYWQRCLKSLLPSDYAPMDPNRMSLAFFTISALDLLDALDTSISSQEKQSYVDWVYRCQHPEGGFRGFPGTDLGHLSAPSNSVWDPANIPATYFALGILLILRDDLQHVKRESCLDWLAKMQRFDGSFGETMGPGGSIEGGYDTRFAYTALCIRHFLRRPGDKSPDINVQKLTCNITKLQTYDGGYSDEEFHEAHGGYTYCSISALSIMKKADIGIRDRELLVHWLASRQTLLFANDEDSHQEEKELEPDKSQCGNEYSFTGLNGRPNKCADTCYCWWIVATVKTLGSDVDIIDIENTKNFLLAKTQRTDIGGFGKHQGDVPDIFHSYTGLATLSLLGCSGLKPINANFCISKSALD